jgi:predicted NBD/HSP70 family sugar kinase
MARPVAVGTTFMLEVNAAAILTRLRSVGRASVSGLAKQTGLSRQAVTRSLAVLESMSLVEISAPDRAASAAGRPPQMVRFRAEAGHVMGVDVQPRQVRILVTDLAGIPTTSSTLPLDRSSRDALAESLRAAIVTVLGEAGDVWHVSAAAPGIVDPVTGHVTLSPSLPEAVGDAIPAGIRAALDAPFYVDNDVKLATQGERWRGAPHVEDTLVFIDWGERIGAGIVLRGELHRGASNDAGDLGYLDLVVPGSQTSGDGDLGPFESWVGTRELLRIASGAAERAVTLAEVAAAARGGEGWALTAIRTVGARFAKGIAAIRSLLDPELIVIGGDVAEFGPVLIDVLADALRSERLNQPRLEISTLGADAIIYGAVRHSLSWVERERLDIVAIRHIKET